MCAGKTPKLAHFALFVPEVRFEAGDFVAAESAGGILFDPDLRMRLEGRTNRYAEDVYIDLNAPRPAAVRELLEPLSRWAKDCVGILGALLMDNPSAQAA